MGGKGRRHALIAGLLRERPVRSQEDLKALLERRGVEVTQATLSRDLHEIGVVKTPEGYAMPSGAEGGVIIEPRRSGHEPGRALREYVLDIQPAGTLVVLKTGPGRAQALSLELDQARIAGVIGTVAGDDTIFVATASEKDARALRKKFLDMAGIG